MSKVEKQGAISDWGVSPHPLFLLGCHTLRDMACRYVFKYTDLFQGCTGCNIDRMCTKKGRGGVSKLLKFLKHPMQGCQ